MKLILNNIKYQITLIFAIVIAISFSTTALFTSISFQDKFEKLIQQELKSDIRFSKELLELRLPGDWSARGNSLYKGEVLINNNFEIVDMIKEISGNTASIFLGNTRVTTNVLKPNGERAVGTKVSPLVENTVLKNNKPYYGAADVLGVMNQTAYEPILNRQGEVIGILYVGIPSTTYKYLINEFILLMIAISTIILILGGGVMLYFINKKISPLKSLTEVTKKIAKGDLKFDYTIKESEDEIGVLSSSVHIMKDQIYEVISKMKQATLENNKIVTKLSNYSIDLSYTAGIQTEQSKEFHSTFLELSKSSKKINENIESSVDSTKNVSNIILEFINSF
ncbi:MAG: cache domain-containing protein [Leptospiraceae bacterium]|nr:cache domain-containing protein [Leptospiraceae bacterium]